MIDFIIEMLAEVAGFFFDLWTNRIIGKFRKKDN